MSLLIDTPILLRYGIDCRPLLVQSEGSAEPSLVFLLENVGDAYAARLRSAFHKLSEGRYVSRIPPDGIQWSEIFPDSSVQQMEPQQFVTPAPGRALRLPASLRVWLGALSDPQLQAMIKHAGTHHYVRSLDNLRHSLAQGWIDKPCVKELLAMGCKQLLHNSPEATDVSAFLAALYREMGSSETLDVDVARIFELMQAEGRFADQSLQALLPSEFCKGSYQYVRLVAERFQLQFVTAGCAAVLYENCASLEACYQLLAEKGYLQAVAAPREEYQALEARWIALLARTDFGEGLAGDEAVLSSEIAGERVSVTRYDGGVAIANIERRLVVVQRPDGQWDVAPVPPSWWVDQFSVEIPEFFRLIWGVGTSGGVVTGGSGRSVPAVDADAGSLIYPATDEILLTLSQVASKARRRQLINETFWAPLYSMEPTLTLAQRVVLGRLYEDLPRGFIGSAQTLDSAQRFLGALLWLRQQVEGMRDLDVLHLMARVMSTLVDAGVVAVGDATGIEAWMPAGETLLEDLQVARLHDRQKLLRLLTDRTVWQRDLRARMAYNWPLSAAWWMEGFECEYTVEGWQARRHGHLIVSSLPQRDALIWAVLHHVRKQRVHALRVNGTEVIRYLSRHGIYYDLTDMALDEDVQRQAFCHIPSKQELRVRGVRDSSGVQLNIEDQAGVAEALRDAWACLAEVGIAPDTLQMGGTLGLRTLRYGTEISISMWNAHGYITVQAGEVAFGWAALWYGELMAEQGISEYPHQLGFPVVEDAPLSAVLESIALRRHTVTPSVLMMDEEAALRSEVFEVYGIEIGDLSQQTEEAFGAVEAELLERMAAREGYDAALVRRLRSLRHALWAMQQQPEVERYTDFMQHALTASRQLGMPSLRAPAYLFARAFEAYIEDALRGMGWVNDYLVYGTDSEARMGASVHPHGYERLRNSIYFDRLFLAPH